MSLLARPRGVCLSCVLMLIACSSSERAHGGPNAASPNGTTQPASHSAQAAPSTVASRLCNAASAGDFVMVKALLDQGADVNAVDPLDPRRNTPLIAAVEPGHFTVVKLLLARGANVAAVNAQGESATDIARTKNYEAILVLLGMRKASEVEIADPIVQPLDPARLDPGALIRKIEAVTEKSPAGTKTETAAAPTNGAPVLVAEPTEHAAPAPSAPDPSKAEVPEEKKRELCAQVETAMAQLAGADEAELKELGMSREAAIAELQATVGDGCK